MQPLGLCIVNIPCLFVCLLLGNGKECSRLADAQRKDQSPVHASPAPERDQLVDVALGPMGTTKETT